MPCIGKYNQNTRHLFIKVPVKIHILDLLQNSEWNYHLHLDRALERPSSQRTLPVQSQCKKFTNTPINMPINLNLSHRKPPHPHPLSQPINNKIALLKNQQKHSTTSTNHKQI